MDRSIERNILQRRWSLQPQTAGQQCSTFTTCRLMHALSLWVTLPSPVVCRHLHKGPPSHQRHSPNKLLPQVFDFVRVQAEVWHLVTILQATQHSQGKQELHALAGYVTLCLVGRMQACILTLMCIWCQVALAVCRGCSCNWPGVVLMMHARNAAYLRWVTVTQCRLPKHAKHNA